MQHLINTRDFSIEEVDALYKRAEEFLDEKQRDTLKDKMVITIFLKTLQEHAVALR